MDRIITKRDGEVSWKCIVFMKHDFQFKYEENARLFFLVLEFLVAYTVVLGHACPHGNQVTCPTGKATITGKWITTFHCSGFNIFPTTTTQPLKIEDSKMDKIIARLRCIQWYTFFPGETYTFKEIQLTLQTETAQSYNSNSRTIVFHNN